MKNEGNAVYNRVDGWATANEIIADKQDAAWEGKYQGSWTSSENAYVEICKCGNGDAS